MIILPSGRTELGLRVAQRIRILRRAGPLNKYDWKENPGFDHELAARLAEEFDIPLAGARFLVSRSLTTGEAVSRYLAPVPAHAHDPFEFENMGAAVALVEKTIAGKKPVLIHGDYDVDGISGTALLYYYLTGVFDKIYRFVPDRRKDGYGVSERAVDWALEEGVGLFVAVDCGTSDGKLISRLEENGVGVVVCDHHEFPAAGDAAGVLLNPVRDGETYPFKSLCGTGVAYKLTQALHQRGIRGKYEPEELLDLLALATVGDMSPLVDENRYFVRAGLDLMNRSTRPGLLAIKTRSRLGTRDVTSTDISFIIAPRLNAPGRISKPKPSLEILCAGDGEGERVAQLAHTLEHDNDTRKDLTGRVHADAAARIRALQNADEMGGFVLAGKDWDEGVLGIAAARVAGEFLRPAILLAVKGDVAKGSGRSIPGVNLKKHLDRFGEELIRYGGHAQAVGLTMNANTIESFGERLSKNLLDDVRENAAASSLDIVGALDLEECNHELLDFLARCEPFGLGNRRPLWKITDLQIMRSTCLVGDGHMKLYFQDTRGNQGEAIAFNWDRPHTPDDLHGRVVDVVVSVRKGTFRDVTYPELRLVDIR